MRQLDGQSPMRWLLQRNGWRLAAHCRWRCRSLLTTHDLLLFTCNGWRTCGRAQPTTFLPQFYCAFPAPMQIANCRIHVCVYVCVNVQCKNANCCILDSYHEFRWALHSPRTVMLSSCGLCGCCKHVISIILPVFIYANILLTNRKV